MDLPMHRHSAFTEPTETLSDFFLFTQIIFFYLKNFVHKEKLYNGVMF